MYVDTQPRHHDAPYIRLFQWFGLSLFFHVALVTFVGGTLQIHPHRPLVVDLQHILPATADPLTNSVIPLEKSPETVVDNPLPQALNPTKVSERPHELPKQAVDLPVPFDRYLSVDEVDIRAEPANDVRLTYPVAAYVRRIPGVVQLNLFINEEGKLDRIDLIDATPKGIFEKDAIDTVSKLHFYPATRYGRPVKSQKTIEVVFDPNPMLDRAKPTPATPTPSAAEK
jgi:TonB family protein